MNNSKGVQFMGKTQVTVAIIELNWIELNWILLSKYACVDMKVDQ